MDVIKIRDLEIYGHHGVMKEENVLGQKFLVSLALYTDTRAAGESDNLADSVNYAEVSYLVKEQMEKETYRLIEAAAEQLAKKILLKFPLVKKVEVEIKKPWAPILLPLDTVSVSITRGWETAYLSIGSNMGDRKAYLEAAIEELKKVSRRRHTSTLPCRRSTAGSWTPTALACSPPAALRQARAPMSPRIPPRCGTPSAPPTPRAR